MLAIEGLWRWIQIPMMFQKMISGGNEHPQIAAIYEGEQKGTPWVSTLGHKLTNGFSSAHN